MKVRAVMRFVLVLVISLAQAGLVAAEQLSEGVPPVQTLSQAVGTDPHARLGLPSSEMTAWEALAQSPVASRAAPQGPAAPDVALGQAGLSFGYVRTFGVTEQAYIADVQHFNGPSGIFVDTHDNLYVAEFNGARLLKLDPAGSNLMSIGTAGLQVVGQYTFESLRDVAVDGSGNIWVVTHYAVQQYTPQGTFLQQLPANDPGNSGNDTTHFNEPIGIAFDSQGRMYIADIWNQRVQIYTFADGKPVYVATIGVTGVSGSDNSHFDRPHHITIDAADNLFVADTFNHRIQIYNSAHAYVGTIGIPGQSGSDNNHLNEPRGVHANAGKIYVADSMNARVQVFDQMTLAYQTTIGTGKGASNSQWGLPYDIATDAAGNLYVADYTNHRVQKLSPTGAYIRTFGITGVPYLTDGYHYNRPRTAVDDAGNVIVVEQYGHRLLKLDANGAPLWMVGEAGVTGADNAHFDYPRAVATGPDGHIYVANRCRVQIFSGTGVYQATLGTGCGTGDYEFGYVTGLAIGDDGMIYVSDNNNHRIQIYNSSRAFVGRIGAAGQCGAGNDRLCWPVGVAVDASGNIYVADSGNARVQKFNSNRQWQMTVGTAGSWGDSFAQFNNAEDIAVDAQGRIYVADIWNNRVQVFDAAGAYLTTIGGSWGNKSSQLRHAGGVAVDRAGNVYVEGLINSRVQKFAPGIAGWQQVNINGFGDRWNTGSPYSFVSDGYLYMPIPNYRTGGEIWRSQDGRTWQQINPDGFGNARNTWVYGAVSFGGYLYAGTSNSATGGEIWRSLDAVNWQQTNSGGFGDINNTATQPGAVFEGNLYVDTNNRATGCELWRSSDGAAWEQVNTDGFGDVNNFAIGFTRVFNGYLYAGVANDHTGGELWRSPNGTTWERVISSGFDDALSPHMQIQIEHAGYLYVGAGNNTNGVKLWRSANGVNWDSVNIAPFANSHDLIPYDFMSSDVLESKFYIGLARASGFQVWRTADFVTWEQILWDGFGDSNNTRGWLTAFGNRLYLGTGNDASGSEVWLYLPNRTYLPVVLRQ